MCDRKGRKCLGKRNKPYVWGGGGGGGVCVCGGGGGGGGAQCMVNWFKC